MITLLGLPSLRTCKPACIQAPFLTLHATHRPMATFPSYSLLVLRSSISPPER